MDPVTLAISKGYADAKDTGAFLHREQMGIIAHRGEHVTAPENTLKAIQNAGLLGYEMVELDVRKTVDGEFVLMHDSTVDRTTDGTGNIASMTLAQVRALVVDEDYIGKTDDEVIRVPTFEEACAECRRWGLGINVDGSKFNWTEADFTAVVGYLRRYGLLNRSFFVMTNDDQRDLLASLYPMVAVTWLTSDTDPSANIAKARKYTNAFVTYSNSVVTDALIGAYRAENIPIFVHSCNTIEDLYKYASKGVRFVETDLVLPGGVL